VNDLPPSERDQRHSRLLRSDGAPADVALLQTFIDACPGYALLVDEDHRIVLINQTACDELNLEPYQACGAYCPRLVHGTSGPFPGCPLERAVARNLEHACALQFDEKWRVWLDSEVHLTRFRTDHGKKVYLHVVRDVTEREVVTADLQRRSRELGALQDLLLADSAQGLDALLQRMLDRLLSIPWLTVEHCGAVFLLDSAGGLLRMRAATGLGLPILEACSTVAPGYCLCGRALSTGAVQYSGCIDERHDTVYPGIADHGHYCLPIGTGDDCVGVLNLYLPAQHPRDEREEAFLLAATRVFYRAIVDARSRQALAEGRDRVQASLGAAIQTIGRMLQTRDPYTAGHQHRVAELAGLLGRKLGLDAVRLQGLELAASIHDIGKIGVPAELLTKPSRLTPTELAMIKEHSSLGYDILAGTEFPWPIADIVHQHHECLDGTGYPLGLAGDDILLEARIISVADVAEAIASHRPYRPALGLDAAVDQLRRGRGRKYDEHVVGAFLELLAADEQPAWLRWKE
jgi:HD-GYP domain-containing protein (c-di-GMP phosphodiesterase class II)